MQIRDSVMKRDEIGHVLPVPVPEIVFSGIAGSHGKTRV